MAARQTADAAVAVVARVRHIAGESRYDVGGLRRIAPRFGRNGGRMLHSARSIA